ncbi:hypothetical protein GGS23DRAFT_598500 [Durotheca rogersii]|uniref:uncharacterized protein n=1 Tax=Durotheca rogersii TaxID=419775 RepID=UPI002220AE10|nr:uncharacterized protein GGS23DRAFT_598500 [Durotheca rogersii]KAI5861331.1 hypothetical protein GGS23DRAFT_598500 [Durotheca rogersii]
MPKGYLSLGPSPGKTRPPIATRSSVASTGVPTVMAKENDVIAIIIIVLFIVLALIAFGIYRLVHLARTQASISESSSGSSGIAD